MLSLRSFGRIAQQRSLHALPSRRCFNAATTAPNQIPTNNTEQGKVLVDVEHLLSEPTWSISSLLPPKDSNEPSEAITSTQLHHLLRLSALPSPSTPDQERQMLETLSSQLHFVRAIQNVDTAGVQPLGSLRDETRDGEKEAEVGLEAMKGALEGEEVVGKFYRRVRRKKVGKGGEEWDVLGQAGRKTGRYFVVEGGKKEG